MAYNQKVAAFYAVVTVVDIVERLALSCALNKGINNMAAQFEWNVYVNGRYVGTMSAAADEEEARLAAIHKFDIASNARISVNKR